MKSLICAFGILLLVSCSKDYIQIFETSTTNTKKKEDFWVYENDSLILTYKFWASHGTMNFSVFNKLDKPIYIDWKNCSFICNSNKLDYWVDQEVSNLVNYYKGYYISEKGYEKTKEKSSSTTLKPERITFIPPKSFYHRSQFYLLPINYFEIEKKSTNTLVVPRNDDPQKKTTIYEIKFDSTTSPFKFRNFIAYSFSENASEFHFIDNEFFLSSVKEMDYRHYRGKRIRNKDGSTQYEKSFINKTSFYIKKIPKY